jgi:hypothetical protein
VSGAGGRRLHKINHETRTASSAGRAAPRRETLPSRDGSRLISKIAGRDPAWLLDPAITSVSVGRVLLPDATGHRAIRVRAAEGWLTRVAGIISPAGVRCRGGDASPAIVIGARLDFDAHGVEILVVTPADPPTAFLPCGPSRSGSSGSSVWTRDENGTPSAGKPAMNGW